MAGVSSSARIMSRGMRVLVCAMLVATMIPVVSAQAVVPPGATFYVDVASGDNANPGTEAAPFKSITAALDGAMAGDTIMVAPGTYSSSESTSSGEEFPLSVRPGVKLKSSGGADVTLVDAEYRSGVIRVVGSKDVGATDHDPPPFAANPAIVEGLTLTGGDEPEGGAIRVAGADAILRNLTITECYAYRGAGVYVANSLTAIENCEFVENGWVEDGFFKNIDLPLIPEPEPIPDPIEKFITTAEGGGLFVEESHVTVTGSTFRNNTAGESGGGIAAMRCGLSVSDTVFEGNSAGIMPLIRRPGADRLLATDYETDFDMLPPAGGGLFAYAAGVEVSGCDFKENTAIFGGGCALLTWTMADITQSRFDSNAAYEGGAVLSAGSDFFFFSESDDASTEIGEASLLLDQCVFEDSWAGWAVVQSMDSSTTVQNSLFNNNTSGMAMVYTARGWWTTQDDVSVDDSIPSRVLQSTFSSNTAELSVYAPSGLVSNVICWGNDRESHAIKGGLPPEESPGPADVWAPIVSFSDLENGVRPTILADWGINEGNISEDPMFAWPEERDFSLIAGSPCIDTTAAPGAADYDLVGTERPMDGDNDGDAAWDMGAYEYIYDGDTRTGGEDRYNTSVAAVQEYFDSSDAVVIARGDVFADGLAAAGLCGVYQAPLLLTRPYALPEVTKAEIERLGATEAYIMGGVGAVSEEVAAELADMGLSVERIGGETRYQTAALIADKIESESGTPTATFIARGDLFADALTVSPVAYGLAAPILLVRPDELPEATVDVLGDLSPSSVVIAGGTGAVSSGVEAGIESVTVAADRIDGANRYETSVAFSEFAVDQGWANWDTVGLATGLAFPDALTGGPAVGESHGVLLLTPGEELSASVETALTDNAALIGRLDVLGGSGAIADSVKEAAAAAID